MAKTSLIDRVHPSRPRERTIPWPFPVEGKPPSITVKVLSSDELEAAYFATTEHYKKAKKKVVAFDDPAFVLRERVEILWRAVRDAETGDPIAESPAALMDQPARIRDVLYQEVMALQADVAPIRYTQAELLELVDHLKKNMDGAALSGSSFSLLTELCITLVGLLGSSTPASESGS